MINPIDLRIGNIVLIAGTGKVHPTVLDARNLAILFDSPEYASPMPLNTGLLLNECGFDHYHSNPRLEDFYVNKQGYYPFFVYTTRAIRYMVNENYEIKYLHELQNAYRWATGSELKIEL